MHAQERPAWKFELLIFGWISAFPAGFVQGDKMFRDGAYAADCGFLEFFIYSPWPNSDMITLWAVLGIIFRHKTYHYAILSSHNMKWRAVQESQCQSYMSEDWRFLGGARFAEYDAKAADARPAWIQIGSDQSPCTAALESPQGGNLVVQMARQAIFLIQQIESRIADHFFKQHQSAAINRIGCFSDMILACGVLEGKLT